MISAEGEGRGSKKPFWEVGVFMGERLGARSRLSGVSNPCEQTKTTFGDEAQELGVKKRKNETVRLDQPYGMEEAGHVD